MLQETLVQVEHLVLRDHLDQKDKRDKKAMGCVVSSTWGGAGQAVVEMLRLYTQVSAFYRDFLKYRVERETKIQKPVSVFALTECEKHGPPESCR